MRFNPQGWILVVSTFLMPSGVSVRSSCGTSDGITIKTPTSLPPLCRKRPNQASNLTWRSRGEQFVSNPPAFEELRVTFGERIVHYGQADHSSYVDLLRRADVVVSTARQEFFGIAITEAVYAGAFPLLPNALVYPERIPEKHHSICLYDDRADLLTKLTSALTHREQARSVAESLHPVMAQFDWNVVGPQLDKRFEALRVEGR